MIQQQNDRFAYQVPNYTSIHSVQLYTPPPKKSAKLQDLQNFNPSQAYVYPQYQNFQPTQSPTTTAKVGVDQMKQIVRHQLQQHLSTSEIKSIEQEINQGNPMITMMFEYYLQNGDKDFLIRRIKSALSQKQVSSLLEKSNLQSLKLQPQTDQPQYNSETKIKVNESSNQKRLSSNQSSNTLITMQERDDGFRLRAQKCASNFNVAQPKISQHQAVVSQQIAALFLENVGFALATNRAKNDSISIEEENVKSSDSTNLTKIQLGNPLVIGGGVTRNLMQINGDDLTPFSLQTTPSLQKNVETSSFKSIHAQATIPISGGQSLSPQRSKHSLSQLLSQQKDIVLKPALNSFQQNQQTINIQSIQRQVPNSSSGINPSTTIQAKKYDQPLYQPSLKQEREKRNMNDQYGLYYKAYGSSSPERYKY